MSSFSITVNTFAVNGLWITSAVTLSIIVTLYRFKGLFVFIVPTFLLYLWNITEITDGGMWVINRITYTYSRWLSMPELFPQAKNLVSEPTAFIAAAGVLITILLAVSICLRRSAFTTILITAPIIFLTFVVSDAQADVIYLLGLVAVYLTLIAGAAIAPDNYIKRGLVTLPATAISVVFMLIVYLLAPYNDYSRSDYIINLGNNFRLFATQIGQAGLFSQRTGINIEVDWTGSGNGGLWQFNTNTVNIANAADRKITNKSLLQINSNYPGTFYIRGYSMGDFNGKSWVRESDRQMLLNINDAARGLPAAAAEFYAGLNPGSAPPMVEMMIRRTGDVTADITYQPYYSDPSFENIDVLFLAESFYYITGVHDLFDKLNDLSYFPGVHFGNFIDNERIHEIYTNIDDNTAEGLRRLAREAGINSNTDRYIIADSVASYIMSSAVYTLSPGTTPSDADFALHFLEESKKGYCIHFTTAAVLMLRALDVPARFTTGYVVSVPAGNAGTTTTLTDSNAHAWVEVFYEDIGWVYLEVTPPSSGNTYVPRQRPHTPDTVITSTPPPSETPEPLPPVTTPPPATPPPGAVDIRPPDTGTNNDRQNILSLPPFMYNIAVFLFSIFLLITILLTRRMIHVNARTKRFTQKDANKAVICIWSYITRLGAGEITMPNDIEELALKARFSQHRISENEREEMKKFAERLAFEIYDGKEDTFRRFWIKYIKALY